MASHPLLLQHYHRQDPLPTGVWSYYQEWNRALFLHWKVPENILSKLLPPGLTLDTFEGNAYVSLVAFTMEKIRPRLLPALDFISNFDEINIRTYINQSGRQGVYFLNIEAAKPLSSLIAKALSGLSYEPAKLLHRPGHFFAKNKKKNFNMDLKFDVAHDLIKNKTKLDRWLTERYSLFLNRGSTLFRYDIHHLEWPLHEVQLNGMQLDYRIQGLHLHAKADLMHYSPGVQVLAWKRIKIN